MKKLVKKTKRNFRRLTKSGISILCLLLMLALLTGAVFAAAEKRAHLRRQRSTQKARPPSRRALCPAKGLARLCNRRPLNALRKRCLR